MYYQGDYYQGDYYQGDPGIFGNLFRGVTRTIGGAIGGLLKGGPIGGIVGAVGGAASAVRANVEQSVLESGDTGSAYTPALRAKHAMAVMRGGAGGGAPIRGALAAPGVGGAMVGPPLPAGFHVRRTHLNKATYYRRGGGVQNLTPGLVYKCTEYVPNRRMNVANPRALRRAIRRVSGFGKIVKRMKRAVARANSAVGNVRHARGKAFARRR